GTKIKVFQLKNLLRFFYNVQYIIPSQSVFVSKRMFDKVGTMDEHLHYCMDLEWFVRIALEEPIAYRHPDPICFFRTHSNAKTSTASDNMREEAIEIAYNYSAFLSPTDRKQLLRLIFYSNVFKEYHTHLEDVSLSKMLNTAISFPIEVISDTRYLGLLKRKLLFSMNKE
ncbi:MAG: hypothetical protein KDJ65_37500, partial [Anaerolineae bacterium]|nr:hypothetical protein [Anaerolineae bacterium]